MLPTCAEGMILLQRFAWVCTWTPIGMARGKQPPLSTGMKFLSDQTEPDTNVQSDMFIWHFFDPISPSIRLNTATNVIWLRRSALTGLKVVLSTIHIIILINFLVLWLLVRTLHNLSHSVHFVCFFFSVINHNSRVERVFLTLPRSINFIFYIFYIIFFFFSYFTCLQTLKLQAIWPGEPKCSRGTEPLSLQYISWKSVSVLIKVKGGSNSIFDSYFFKINHI